MKKLGLIVYICISITTLYSQKEEKIISIDPSFYIPQFYINDSTEVPGIHIIDTSVVSPIRGFISYEIILFDSIGKMYVDSYKIYSTYIFSKGGNIRIENSGKYKKIKNIVEKKSNLLIKNIFCQYDKKLNHRQIINIPFWINVDMLNKNETNIF